ASLVPKKQQVGSSDGTPNGDQGVLDRERIVSIDNLTIGDPQVRNREMILTAKFTANTYRQEEKVEPAAAKPAAGAAAAPATAPAKPLPPAATPAGAKARANDAMNKDEKRSGSDAQRLKGGL
ncbi:MAG TPA: hypothetical protein VF403_07800, partial [Kofleriaceae bacterium]